MAYNLPMPAAQTAPALSSIVTINGESYKVVSIDSGDAVPLVRADLIASGFDGCHYMAERVLVGRQRVKRTALFTRTNSGEIRTIAIR
jgi:hypothetical protein